MGWKGLAQKEGVCQDGGGTADLTGKGAALFCLVFARTASVGCLVLDHGGTWRWGALTGVRCRKKAKRVQRGSSSIWEYSNLINDQCSDMSEESSVGGRRNRLLS